MIVEWRLPFIQVPLARYRAGMTTPVLKTVKYEPPPQRQKGVMVKDAAELVAALRQKGLV
jgi:electron transfer flavoprotein alpha/beta subunit